MKPSASTVFASSISSTRLRLYTALRASFCKAKWTLNVVVVRRVVECPENFLHLLPLAKTVAALASAELVHRISGAACSSCLVWKLGMPAPMAAAPRRMSSSPSVTHSPIVGGAGCCGVLVDEQARAIARLASFVRSRQWTLFCYARDHYKYR